MQAIIIRSVMGFIVRKLYCSNFKIFWSCVQCGQLAFKEIKMKEVVVCEILGLKVLQLLYR